MTDIRAMVTASHPMHVVRGCDLCDAAASAPSSPATPAPLEVERLARAITVAEGFEGWTPWASERTNAALIARAYANQEGGDCEHGIPRSECKLIEHTR